MSTLDDLAGKLAEDTLAAMETTGNDRLYVEVGDLLAASSQSLEEAFLTEIRVRLAEQAARRFLDAKIAAARAAAAPDPST
ncbi:hypothetical protein ACFMPD_02675 [Sedimentitalea sp. HM32M-2]|uniref:hypothetical protein n=1 Tax=Sedimentitalea sp. HM32M-2 TaxID=3351566 RepID=UPI00363BBB29